jgi:hypothetical protein
MSSEDNRMETVYFQFRRKTGQSRESVQMLQFQNSYSDSYSYEPEDKSMVYVS